MPWNTQEVELDSDQPFIKLVDKKRDFHMEIEMSDPREVHLYIGSANPETSRLHVVTFKDGVSIERAHRYLKGDIVAIDVELKKMKCSQAVRRKALKPLWDTLKDRADGFVSYSRRRPKRRKPRDPGNPFVHYVPSRDVHREDQ